jgi:uncharacterized protein (DUF433 family)
MIVTRCVTSVNRMRVKGIIVWHERRGYSPDEMVEMFPGITLGDVHAALAYMQSAAA